MFSRISILASKNHKASILKTLSSTHVIKVLYYNILVVPSSVCQTVDDWIYQQPIRGDNFCRIVK